MYIVLAILGTFLIDFLVGALINSKRNKQLKRDEDLFIFKLDKILKDKNATGKERKDSAIELCRMTEGKIASGVYFALCNDNVLIKD